LKTLSELRMQAHQVQRYGGAEAPVLPMPQTQAHSMRAA
jgi:hypothetical protein